MERRPVAPDARFAWRGGGTLVCGILSDMPNAISAISALLAIMAIPLTHSQSTALPTAFFHI